LEYLDIENFSLCGLANDEYSDRLTYIVEAGDRVLKKENLFAILNSTVKSNVYSVHTNTLGTPLQKAIRHSPSSSAPEPGPANNFSENNFLANT